MSAPLRRITRDQAKQERAELLASTGMTEARLRAANRDWALDAAERGAIDQINGLDWLMTGVGEACCPCEETTCTAHDGHEGDHQPRDEWWTR